MAPGLSCSAASNAKTRRAEHKLTTSMSGQHSSMLHVLGIHILGKTLTNWSKCRGMQLDTHKLRQTASVTKVLQDLKWPPLLQRHQQNGLSVMYKISSQLADTDSSCYLIMSQHNTKGHSARSFQPFCNSAVYANSFFVRNIRDWNQLSTNPLDFKPVDSFKSYLNSDTKSKFS